MSQPEKSLDITTFLVSSIHDMKNSVSVMTAILEDVMHQADDQHSPTAGKIGQVFYEAQRVGDNLMQLVALYKIDRQFYPFDPQEHDVDLFAEEAVGRILPLASHLGMEVELDCPAGLCWFFDRELLFGAIVQALHNGVRYTKKRVLLTIRVVDAQLEFRIEDDGNGYPKGMIEGGHDPSPGLGVHFASGSTGLGLYFSSVVARLHRNRGREGSTRLDNGGTLGGGVFILTLP